MNQNKEKLEAQLYQQYNEALDLLEQGLEEGGRQKLRALLDDPLLHRAEYSSIASAVYHSLAESMAQTDDLEQNCQALHYYFKSCLIHEDWQKTKKMGLLFRKIGMIPKALSLTIKSLNQCLIQVLRPPILHQICQLCFLMNDSAQLAFYFKQFPPNEPLRSQILDVLNYHTNTAPTPFVKALLQEKAAIVSKLQRLPYHQSDFTAVFHQAHKIELRINIYDPAKFLVKLKHILAGFLSRQNIQPLSETHNKSKEKLVDEKLLTDTCILISQKLATKLSKHKQTKDQNAKDREPVKQSERQREKNIKKTQLESYNLDQYVYSNFKDLLDILRERFGVSLIDNSENQKQKPIFENKETRENPISKELLVKLHATYPSLVHLLSHLVSLLMRDVISEEAAQSPELLNQQKIQQTLVSCLIMAQHVTNVLTRDPQTALKILEIAYEKLQMYKREKKSKTPKKQQKIENHILLINSLKQYLIFECQLSDHIRDQRQLEEFLAKYNNFMAFIHTDPNFFQSRLAKHFARQIKDEELQQQVVSKLKSIKLNKSDFNIHKAQQIVSIIEQFEQMESIIDFSSKNLIQIDQLYEVLSETPSLELVKRIMQIAINQFYFSTTKEQLKQIYQKSSECKLPIRFIKLITNPDEQFALLCLRYALIICSFEDSSELLSYFIAGFLPQKYLEQFQQKQLQLQCQQVPYYIVVLKLLQIPNVNLFKLFDQQRRADIISLLILLRVNINSRYQQLLASSLMYFNDNLELVWYVISQINLTHENFSLFRLKRMEFEQELADEVKYEKVDALPSQTEDDYDCLEYLGQNFCEVTYPAQQLIDKIFIQGRLQRLEEEQRQVLLNNRISINLGNPLIVESIKHFLTELVKQEYGINTNQVAHQIKPIIEQYYLSLEQIDKLIDLQFIGYYLPHITLKQETLNSLLKLIQLPDIPNEIYQFQSALSDSLFSQAQCMNKAQLDAAIASVRNFQSIPLSNLYYSLAKQSSHEASEKNEDKKIQLGQLFLALAYNDCQFLWEKIYLTIFGFAEIEFNLKSQPMNWFLVQKKCYSLIKEQDSFANPFHEHRIIMDMLKLHQRRLKYQVQAPRDQQQFFERVNAIIQEIYQPRANQSIPKILTDLTPNLRAKVLHEKIVVRKYRLLKMQELRQHILNLKALRDLIVELNQRLATKKNPFLNGRDYEGEAELDIYISVYKFIKRFIRNNAKNSLSEFLAILRTLEPSLFEPVQNAMAFQFPEETKMFKRQYFENDIGQYFESDDYQLVLNNLLLKFQQTASKFVKRKLPRYLVQAMFYTAHMYYHATDGLQKASEMIMQLFISNSKDLVYYYKMFDKQRNLVEKDEIMAYYFNHDTVYYYQKSKILKLIIDILFAQGKIKELISVADKMSKQPYEMRIVQVYKGLVLRANQLHDAQLLKDIIRKLQAQKKGSEDVGRHLTDYDALFAQLAVEENKECLMECYEAQVQQGKKILEEYKQQQKRKTKKEKEQSQPANADQIQDLNNNAQLIHTDSKDQNQIEVHLVDQP